MYGVTILRSIAVLYWYQFFQALTCLLRTFEVRHVETIKLDCLSSTVNLDQKFAEFTQIFCRQNEICRDQVASILRNTRCFRLLATRCAQRCEFCVLRINYIRQCSSTFSIADKLCA
ncbi:hypothetical protein N185_00735 [Sinorhizobium sp. GW3]|nr:hypothetical protein N185_00735 [Sinorhizobium sp. GW3]